MKNITVSVDEEVYRRARIRAAELDTSVSAVVRESLIKFAATESEFERLKRQEQELRQQIRGPSAGDRLSRDAIHDRHGPVS